MFDKVTIFNLALDALLLTTRIIDADTDTIPQAKVLRQMYPIALAKTLGDLDLNATATKVELEQVDIDADNPHWQYAYKYPVNCAKFRRLVSPFVQDNATTRISSETATLDGIRIIYTNETEAWASIQGKDIPLSSLNASAGLALANQLAILCSSLIVGKGAADLRKSIQTNYILFKAEAQELDMEENIDTTPDEFSSEFVNARLGGNKWPLRT